MTDAHVLARDASTARGWLTALGRPAFVAVDVETTGYDPQLDELLTVQVDAGPQRPTLVLDARAVSPAVLSPLLGDDATAKVFHHGAFDLRFLWAAGVEVVRVADTMIAEQLLDGGQPAPSGRGLAALASFRTGRTLDKSVRAGFADGGPLTDAQVAYGAADARATWEVFDQQRTELSRGGLAAVARLEFAVLPVLAGLAARGVRLDVHAWSTVVDRLATQLPSLEAAAQEALVSPASPRDLFGPAPVNLDAPEQVRAALERVGVDVDSTREAALRDHAATPAVAALLAYRQAARLLAAWGGDWSSRVVHPRSGRVHADWRQIVGAGRIACRDPNLTQIPRDPVYRRCVVAPPGRCFVVADYSQQELRILAAVSGDAALREVFASGDDLHRRTAATAFGVTPESVTADQRAAAKALNFGLMYGMGVQGFARATGMSPLRAAEVMDAYFAAFPGVASWLSEAERSGRRAGRTRTPLGRVRTMPPDVANPATFARNAPIQGAGADMTKAALVEVQRRLRTPSVTTAGQAGPVLVVHDEIVVEVDAGAAAHAAEVVAEAMVAAAADLLGDVPCSVQVSVAPTWAGTT